MSLLSGQVSKFLFNINEKLKQFLFAKIDSGRLISRYLKQRAADQYGYRSIVEYAESDGVISKLSDLQLRHAIVRFSQ